MRSGFLTRLLTVVALFLIASASAAISIYTLFPQSIRLDESQSLWQATKSFGEIFYLIGQDVHVPLYESILHIWIQIFGTSIVAARTLSLSFFIMSIFALYIFYRQVTTRKIALVSILIYAFSPFMLWYSSEARMYSLFALVSTLNSYYFLKFLKSEGKAGRVGFFFTLLVGFYTHYFFVFFIVCQAIYLYGYCVREAMREQDAFDTKLLLRVFKNELVRTYISINLLAFLLFIPWLVYFIILGAAANTQPMIARPTSYNVFLAFLNFLFGFQSQKIQTIAVSLWPLVVMSFFFLFTQGNRKKTRYMGYFVIMSFLPIALAYIVSYFRPIFLSRYLICTIPSLYLLVVWTLMSYEKKIASILVAVFFMIMVGLLMYQNISSDIAVKEDYTGVTHYLGAAAGGSDVIAVTPPFTLYPVEYSYSGKARVATIPEWDRYKQRAIPGYDEQKLQQQLRKYKVYERLFIVFSYDQGYEEKLKHYMETHYQRLALKKFSPGLEVRAYKMRYP